MKRSRSNQAREFLQRNKIYIDLASIAFLGVLLGALGLFVAKTSNDIARLQAELTQQQNQLIERQNLLTAASVLPLLRLEHEEQLQWFGEEDGVRWPDVGVVCELFNDSGPVRNFEIDVSGHLRIAPRFTAYQHSQDALQTLVLPFDYWLVSYNLGASQGKMATLRSPSSENWIGLKQRTFGLNATGQSLDYHLVLDFAALATISYEDALSAAHEEHFRITWHRLGWFTWNVERIPEGDKRSSGLYEDGTLLDSRDVEYLVEAAGLHADPALIEFGLVHYHDRVRPTLGLLTGGELRKIYEAYHLCGALPTHNWNDVPFRVPDEEVARAQELEQVELTLLVHDEDVFGPIISGVEVVHGHDGAGRAFHESYDEEGSVTIRGAPGLWRVWLEKEGYHHFAWGQSILSDSRMETFLLSLMPPSIQTDSARPVSPSELP